MIKFWRVCTHEYLRHVLRKRFIFALLSMPLVVIAIALVGYISVAIETNPRPVGYVDLSGWLANAVFPSTPGKDRFSRVELVSFIDEPAAKSALERKEIQAFYVIEPDYLQTGHVRVVAYDSPSENAQQTIRDFLRRNLLSGQSQMVVERILGGSKVIVRSASDQRQADSENWYNLLIPILSGVLFIVVINTSGGYLLQAVVEEKENRTMEIVVTSVSSQQLMAGKVIGNMSVGLTQMVVWVLFPTAAFLILRNRIPILQSIVVDIQSAWLSFITLILAFIMVAALMAMVGATATEAREAQQVSGLFTLPLVMPLWFTAQIIQNPNGALSTGLSIFPLTSPISLPMRAAFSAIPAWQTFLSLGLLSACAILAMWLAGKAFRLGMLRYGKRLGLKELFRRK